MAIFGRTVAGSQATSLPLNGLTSSRFHLSEKGEVTALNFLSSAASGSAKWRAAVYAANVSGEPAGLLIASAEVVGVVAGTNRVTVPPTILDPGDYYLTIASDTAVANISGVASAGTNRTRGIISYPTLPDPFGAASSSSVEKPIFAEYTPNPVSLSISPTHVPPNGGTTVTFTAPEGWLGTAATVTVDGAVVAATVVDATHGTFVTPLHASGAITVSLTSNGITRTATLTYDAVVPPVDTDPARYFLSSLSSVVLLETLEISHPNFSQTYWVVRNQTDGLTAMLENVAPYNGRVQAFDYYPLRIRQKDTRDNLDAGLEVDLGDLGEIIPQEIDRLLAADSTEPPVVKYRTYRSDDLTRPLYGPIRYEMGPITMAKEGASFEAKAPSLNLSRTGATYSLTDFPMLRGVL